VQSRLFDPSFLAASKKYARRLPLGELLAALGDLGVMLECGGWFSVFQNTKGAHQKRLKRLRLGT
jgi:hypothetical protein